MNALSLLLESRQVFRIPQPKLVHFQGKMEVRASAATPSAAGDYRTHFNHPSTSGTPPSLSLPLSPAPPSVLPTHSCTDKTVVPSPETVPVPQQLQAQNSSSSSSSSSVASLSSPTVNASPARVSPDPSPTTNGQGPVTPATGGESNGVDTPRQTIKILSSKGTESLKEMVQ